jgi:hypothetical protein
MLTPNNQIMAGPRMIHPSGVRSPMVITTLIQLNHFGNMEVRNETTEAAPINTAIVKPATTMMLLYNILSKIASMGPMPLSPLTTDIR